MGGVEARTSVGGVNVFNQLSYNPLEKRFSFKEIVTRRISFNEYIEENCSCSLKKKKAEA